MASEVCALIALEKIGRKASATEVARVAGFTARRMRTVLPQLAAAGKVRNVSSTKHAAWVLA